MNSNDLFEFISICCKIKIENAPDLSENEKEFWKQFVDFVKDKREEEIKKYFG